MRRGTHGAAGNYCVLCKTSPWVVKRGKSSRGKIYRSLSHQACVLSPQCPQRHCPDLWSPARGSSAHSRHPETAVEWSKDSQRLEGEGQGRTSGQEQQVDAAGFWPSTPSASHRLPQKTQVPLMEWPPTQASHPYSTHGNVRSESKGWTKVTQQAGG